MGLHELICETIYMNEEEKEHLKHVVEGAIFAAGEPVTLDRLLSLFEDNKAPSKDELKTLLVEIKESCEGRGFDLIEVASGWRFKVREELAPWVNRLWEEKPQKYSRAMLETLALIAYRQPITRGDIEEVRGVAVSSHIIKTLTERGWVRAIGHRDVPGRPALYATTKQFLDYFNLKSLEELPTLGELKDIDNLNNDLEFEEDSAGASALAGEENGEVQSVDADGEALDGESAGEPTTDGLDTNADGSTETTPEGPSSELEGEHGIGHQVSEEGEESVAESNVGGDAEDLAWEAGDVESQDQDQDEAEKLDVVESDGRDDDIDSDEHLDEADNLSPDAVEADRDVDSQGAAPAGDSNLSDVEENERDSEVIDEASESNVDDEDK